MDSLVEKVLVSGVGRFELLPDTSVYRHSPIYVVQTFYVDMSG